MWLGEEQSNQKLGGPVGTIRPAGHGPWPESSAPINQWMGPGPISKKATQIKMVAIQTKLTTSYLSLNNKETVIRTGEKAHQMQSPPSCPFHQKQQKTALTSTPRVTPATLKIPVR